MPLVYQQNINESTKLAVWHITEPEAHFFTRVALPPSVRHPHKRLQHGAGRNLLVELFDDFPLGLIQVADTRKPFLPGEPFHFSISHCGDYAAAIVSKTYRVGVDIEIMTRKTVLIKDKFLAKQEQDMLGAFDPEVLTLAWSIKESLFKWYGDGGVDFKKDLHINELSQNGNQFLAQCRFDKHEPIDLKVHGLAFNDNYLTWLVS